MTGPPLGAALFVYCNGKFSDYPHTGNQFIATKLIRWISDKNADL